MRRFVLLAVGAALALPSPAAAARFGLGVAPGHSAQRVADRVEAYTGRPVTVIGPFAVAVDAPTARGLTRVRGVTYVERLSAKHRRLSFTPNDPLAVRQWYLDRVRAFVAWPRMPVFASVKVAIIDSGIDASHPELRDAIGSGQSFVGSSWRTDTNGHGTFIAGQIAAAVNNAQGIAGIAFQSELMIAKVVRPDGTISPEAEARAIRWAVDNGARVINLSFGGTRYGDSGRDAYSAVEAAAVEYAVKHDVLVVAAVGNGDRAPREPWDYANFPAALPHVLGVSAIARDGSVPDFSNRDSVFNDLAAPGEGIFSTLPRSLTDDRPCVLQGYSECGPFEFRRGDGTSFAAPLVTAAASLVLGDRPNLKPNQVRWILERSARDATPARGCLRCWAGRDDHTGWGVLDVADALGTLAAPVSFPPDQREPNDEAGARAHTVWGRRQEIFATLDFWNDQTDVYRIRVRRNQRVLALLSGLPRGAETSLALWRPGTRRVDELARTRRLAARDDVGVVKQIDYRARRAGGWYYLQVKLSTPLASRYTLRFVKSRLRRPAGARRAARRAASGPGSQQQRFAARRP